MNKSTMSGTRIEIASIVSLVTIFIILELNFGIFRALSVEMLRKFPMPKNIIPHLLVVAVLALVSLVIEDGSI